MTFLILTLLISSLVALPCHSMVRTELASYEEARRPLDPSVAIKMLPSFTDALQVNDDYQKQENAFGLINAVSLVKDSHKHVLALITKPTELMDETQVSRDCIILHHNTRGMSRFLVDNDTNQSPVLAWRKKLYDDLLSEVYNQDAEENTQTINILSSSYIKAGLGYGLLAGTGVAFLAHGLYLKSKGETPTFIPKTGWGNYTMWFSALFCTLGSAYCSINSFLKSNKTAFHNKFKAQSNYVKECLTDQKEALEDPIADSFYEQLRSRDSQIGSKH